MERDSGFPVLRQVVLDGTDVRALAEFYRELLGLRYRPGDQPPRGAGERDPAVRTGWFFKVPTAAAAWPFNRWRSCQRRLGRKVPARSSCTSI
jgi:hypothetical protein